MLVMYPVVSLRPQMQFPVVRPESSTPFLSMQSLNTLLSDPKNFTFPPQSNTVQSPTLHIYCGN